MRSAIRRATCPDVSCDFTAVTLEQAESTARVAGRGQRRRGRAYKVSATYMDGFRCTAQLTVGVDAAAKARTGEAILTRTRELLAQAGLADYSRTHIEVLGSEAATLARTRKPNRCARRCCSWR